MGALTYYADLVSALSAPHQQVLLAKSLTVASGTRWNSTWRSAGAPDLGSIPTTGAICDNTTIGGMRQKDPLAGNESFMVAESLTVGMASGQGSIMIADRLSHMGGLSGTVTTAQTVSLPALTRYTSGEFCIPGVEIYTTIGSTGTTFTANYTDQSGSAKTSQPVPIGATGLNAIGQFIPFSLSNGDYGTRTVSDLTLAATTGAAGNFGVTLIRPLLVIPVNVFQDFAVSGDPLRKLGLLLPKVQPGACLTMMFLGAGAVTSSLSGNINFLEA